VREPARAAHQTVVAREQAAAENAAAAVLSDS
jgi:hypothetical protein